MRYLKIMLLLGACLAGARAEISVVTNYEEIAERGRVVQYVVQSSGQRFQLSPPAGWQMDVEAGDNAIVFRNDKFGTIFRLKFSPNSAPSSQDVDKAIMAKHPGARVAEKFQCVARDAAGLAMELEFAAADGSYYASRCGVLSYGDQQVEFSITGPAEGVRKSHIAWVTVLNSFSRI